MRLHMWDVGRQGKEGGRREERRETDLGAGGMLGVVVLVVGEVEHVLLAEEGGLGGGGGVARPVHLVHQELGGLADVLRGKAYYFRNSIQIHNIKISISL